MEEQRKKYIIMILMFLIVSSIVIFHESDTKKQYDIYKTINLDKGVANFESFKSNTVTNTLSTEIQASLHEKGDVFQVWINCIENGTERIQSTANLSIWYPDGSIFINNIGLTANNIGQFLYEDTTPEHLGVFSIEATCYKDNNKALAYDELQTMNSFEKIKDLYSMFFIEGDFKINSLAVNDVTFTDQAIKTVMSFKYINGSEISFVPDNANLTIYDSNGAEFVFVNLSSFVENNGIYTHSESVGLAPDTGKYEIVLLANKNGLEDKKTTITRVASGGPFYINMDCPASSTVGKELFCEITIEDEGEAPVETRCDMWLDVNNNLYLDYDEASSTFQKLTHPNERLHLDKNIFIPNDLSLLGLQTVQLQCEYLGSILPDAFASDTISLEKPTSSSMVVKEQPSSITKFKEASTCIKILYILIFIIVIISFIFLVFMTKHHYPFCIGITIAYTVLVYILIRLLF